MNNSKTDAGNGEPLHPALASCLEKSGSGVELLRHPLIVSIYHESMNAHFNELFAKKTADFLEASEKRDWSTLLSLFERPFRASVLASVIKHMKKEEAREHLLWVWSDAEWPSVNRAFFLRQFRRLFTGTAVAKEAAGMAAGRPLYRGAQREERGSGDGLGISWTLDRSLAEWFARRFPNGGNTPTLYTLTDAPASALLAYIRSRGEEEIIVDTDANGIAKLVKSQILRD